MGEAMTVSEILEAAAGLIERYGWIQRQWGNKSSGFDLAESITQACPPGDKNYVPAYRVISAHLKGCSLIFWNDEPGRTKEEVIAALRGAASQQQVKEEI